MLLEADLPDDVDGLRALVLEQARALADLSDAKGKADARIERLQAIIEAFQRHRFGRKSEQLDPDQFELGLEDIETALGSVHAARDAATPKPKGERPRKTNRGALPAHLERIEQVVDVEEVDGLRVAALARATGSVPSFDRKWCPARDKDEHSDWWEISLAIM